MARPNYIALIIGGQKADLDPQGQVPTVNYALEDDEDFEVKRSAEVFNIEMPATLINDQIHNTLHQPAVIDSTADQSFDNFRPATYIANGTEIIIGKYLAQSVVKKGNPLKYRGKIYGLNGDWVIDLKEKTLLDFVNDRTHIFDTAAISGSWLYNGRSEANDYVYAPVRYRKAFGVIPEPTEENPAPVPNDLNVLINDLKPAISVYWILYRGFKSAGYKIVSQFMDTDYYRRGVLPWTWGGFDYMDDTRWEPLKFLAAQADNLRFEGNHDDEFANVQAKADGIVPGTFDNSQLFSYTNAASTLPFMMIWKYAIDLGNVRANLSLQLNYAYKAQQGADVSLLIFWYKNGVLQFTDTVYSLTAGGALDPKNGGGFHESFYEGDIVPGDYIGVRVRVHLRKAGVLSFVRQDVQVQAFQLNYLKLTEGSEVNLKNYPKFNKYKWLDLLRGEIDLYDWQINTDPIRKEVYIEPKYGCKIDGVHLPGYHNRKQIDWSQKVDVSVESELELFSDYEREFEYLFKNDAGDGGLKKVQDRNQTTIGMAKYVLPERFKTEKKQKENRFYSAVMHYTHEPFKNITGISPQLIAIIPENIANTSGSESENTFEPKRAWYKGNIAGVGGWIFDGVEYRTLPFMFAVNYKAGGHNDPVLSYSDQLVGGVVASGLLKKFFLQRMAIIRNGRRYNPINIMLNNNDVANFLHRESIIIKDVEYIFNSIKEYNPVDPSSTSCTIWMFAPVTLRDRDSTYPSIAHVQGGSGTGTYDVKYWPHILLTSDIPA